ncbi:MULTISPECIES: EAL and HDOD domain-containing protein [Aliivibrio]|uniref:HDOD domain-containing protein n=1 Tax=Aliivibrio finisterrensis TaxID=511998 RepID=A0A4Q5KU76_9GAMM|nr:MULTISPECIES: HDOD domain-containing protein [Aliivibrio]MDD9179783.1 HDOD domain-containing protein [Aliivibrio sp. A6]RYU50422.1 HDOD domain-containing protein [Aliivibrio finisterrensis]RYU51166.1 HDOD domain-containing protein [Aliivibrio finisterrensis]RYU56989.1 HDOD domain-containing protein [Aliivibrio finisterrensis]RYU63561.1 HDOD domain-containing protein [Aliivibrio finisterrensis]
MYAYVARQPILSRKKQTIGYELLFRDGESNAFPNIEANQATSRLLVENFMSTGCNPALESPRSFINFPQESLISLVPTAFPKRKIVVEVLETCIPNDELFSAIKHLHRMGYIIALDDFSLDAVWDRFLPYSHIVKLDIMQLGIDVACEYVKQRKQQGCKQHYLAEKVETNDEFQQVFDAGFHFYQGYFFSKPEIIKNRVVKPEELLTMQLYQEVCREEVDFSRIEQLIAQDVSLSYQLLKFVNTASVRLENPISSFKQALVYLGEEQIKMFVTLIATAHAAINKPKELYKQSLVKGRFCELMICRIQNGTPGQQAFIVGLFSLLDALLDRKIDDVLEQLSLAREIEQAILLREGLLGSMLELYEGIDKGDWKSIDQTSRLLGFSPKTVEKTYQDAEKWYQMISCQSN